MERERAVLVDLVKEAYPQLETLVNLDRWMSGSFSAPIVFVTAQGVREEAKSLTSYTAVADAGIVLHYPLVEGFYQPLSVEPLRRLLRQKQYSYHGQASDLLIEIDSSTFRIWNDRRDRLEITFRFTFHVAVPKEPEAKIHEFEIEGEWS